MRLLMAFLAILIWTQMLSSCQDDVEATTTIDLPIDSVTIYPDGMVSVKRLGTIDIPEGVNNFVLNIPESADKTTLLLSVSNATIERVVYSENPIYTLNFSSSGKQYFALSYLMYRSGYWEPRYDIHLGNDSMFVKAQAIVRNNGGDDFKNVSLKLVSSLPQQVEPIEAKASRQMQLAFAAPAAPAEDAIALQAENSITGELETLYIFELDGRHDVEIDKDIGLPLLENAVPFARIYNWDAYDREEGPVMQTIKANNTMLIPWPAGKAQIYKTDEYVTSIAIPFTPAGTNASIILGASPDLKVSKKLKDYNETENIRAVKTGDNETHTIRETTKNWTYELKIESNIDNLASLEVADIKPKEAKMLSANPEPSETTATNLKWEINLDPRKEFAIDYSYQIKTTVPIES